MTMVVTTLLFVLITAAFALAHVRRSRSGTGAAPARTCPRCRRRVRHDDAFCVGCGAPIQAFDLVAAPLAASASDGDGGADAPLHALVRTDLCVGCGTCVDACPEPGALAVVDKVARVNLEHCTGHARCAAACPVGAIVLTSGAAVQRIEVPLLSTDFETNVPGLYVVGELGGRGLIKNAINEGKLAVEHVARSLAADRVRAAHRGAPAGDVGDLIDLLIVGSGPAGLSAGLEALRHGLSFRLLEQGTLADSIAKYPRRKLLLAEPARVPLYGDLWVADASKEELLQVWQNVIARSRMEVRTGQRVTGVARDGEGFVVHTADDTHRARRVVLAMGRRGTPRRLGVPGEELDNVFYDVVEMEAFQGQRMLVVGGGDSAVESALGLAHQHDTPVTLSYRSDAFKRVKERNRAKLDAAVAAGAIRVLLRSEVREIRCDAVVLEHDGAARTLPNDAVIVRIGGEAPYPFLERIGVRIVTKELALEPALDGAAG